MTLNKRLKLIAIFILVIPLIALFITSLVFFFTWSLGWEETAELSAPRFLHASLLSALHGDEVSNSRFAGIILVLDHQGHTVYLAPEAKGAIAGRNWANMEDAYAEIMDSLPNIPINITVYNYQGRSGMVIYLEDFFSGRKLFKVNAILIAGFYFVLIVLPILILSLNTRPVMRSVLALETAAIQIGKGNLDTPVQIAGLKQGRRHNFREIESLVRAFEKMRVELKENHENQSRIMMAISHDLKTPLTLIKGYIEALRDGMAQTPEEISGYADVIFDRSMLLEERINDLIYFAKLRTSDWQARFEEFPLSEMLEESFEIFRNDAQIRKRNFSCTSDLSSCGIINGDRKLLSQVLENLFDNACRYTDKNDEIRITVEIDKDTVLVLFEDSGSGISEEHRDHIFDSFYRADSGRNTRGIGIGLTSAKTIIENHGGSIHYSSSSLGGAGFVIELPMVKPL